MNDSGMEPSALCRVEYVEQYPHRAAGRDHRVHDQVDPEFVPVSLRWMRSSAGTWA
jgi:hypothetical protein